MLYRFQEFELDTTRFQLRRGGEPVPVPRQVFDLILFLVRNHERPVTRSELLSHVWGGRVVSDTSLSRCLFLARRALGDNPRQHRFIKTVHGRGYWFVAPVEIVTEPEADRWARLASASSTDLPTLPFTGRDEEILLLLGVVQRTREGHGTVVVIRGAPGIGKTRMCQEAGKVAEQLGVASVYVDCAAVSPPMPLGPWAEVTGGFGEERHAGTPLDSHGFGMGSRPPELAPEWERLRRFARISEALLVDAAHRPRLITLDNLDRSDPETQLLLRYMAGLLVESPLSVVAAARPLASGSVRRLLDEAVRGAGGWTIDLEPLSSADVSRMLESLGGLGGFDVARLYARSGGNPLFIEQLVRRPNSSSSREVPPTLVTAVLSHVHEMPRNVEAGLRLSSVLGARFDLTAAAELLRESPAETVSRLQPAIEAGLVVPSKGALDEYQFRHEVVQEALYSGLEAGEKCALHARVASRLRGRARGRDLLSLAHHSLRALPVVDTAEVLDCVLAAAAWAESQLAFDQASGLLRDALKVARAGEAPSSDLVRIQLRLGSALVRAGRRDEGRDVLVRVVEEHSARAETLGLAGAALSLAPGFFAIEVGVCDSLLVGLLERSLREHEFAPPLKAKLLARLAMAQYWREPRQSLDRISLAAVAAARESGLADVEMEALTWRVGATWSPDSARDRISSLVTSAVPGRLDLATDMVRRVFLVATAVELGDGAAQEREIDRFEADSRITRDPHSQWYVPMFRSMRALAMGRIEEAQAGISRFVEIGSRLGDINVGQCALAQTGEIALQLDVASDALPGLRDHAQRFYRMPEYRCIVALFELLSGNADAAHATAIDVMREWAGATQELRLNSLLGLTALADVAYGVEDEPMASELLEALDPNCELHAMAGYGAVSWGSVGRPIGQLLGVLKRWKEAERVLEQAVKANRKAGNMVWALHSELGLADVLARRGTAEARRRSRDLARAVGFRAEESGLLFLKRKAHALLGGKRP